MKVGGTRPCVHVKIASTQGRVPLIFRKCWYTKTGGKRNLVQKKVI